MIAGECVMEVASGALIILLFSGIWLLCLSVCMCHGRY